MKGSLQRFPAGERLGFPLLILSGAICKVAIRHCMQNPSQWAKLRIFLQMLALGTAADVIKMNFHLFCVKRRNRSKGRMPGEAWGRGASSRALGTVDIELAFAGRVRFLWAEEETPS